MEALLINIIVGFWLVAFGVMAIFPFIIESGAASRSARPQAHSRTQRPLDDQVLSIQPVAMTDRARGPIGEPGAMPDPAHRQAA